MPTNKNERPVQKKYFHIDDIHFAFEGFTHGDTWNGWRTPMFTKDIAEKVLEKVISEDEKVFYDSNKDTFIVIYDEESHDTWKGSTIEFEGEQYTVYDIGAFCWTWDTLDLVKNKLFIELNEIQIFK